MCCCCCCSWYYSSVFFVLVMRRRWRCWRSFRCRKHKELMKRWTMNLLVSWLNNQGDTSNILKTLAWNMFSPLFQFQFFRDLLQNMDQQITCILASWHEVSNQCQAANLEIGSEAERTVFFFVVCIINLGTIFMLSLSCMCFIWNCPKGRWNQMNLFEIQAVRFFFVLGMLSKIIRIFNCVANRKPIAPNTRIINSQHLRCLCHMHQNMQLFWDLFLSGSLSFQHFIHKFHLIQDLGRFFSWLVRWKLCWR